MWASVPLAILALRFTAVLAFPAAGEAATAIAAPCITGTPVVTAGYTISYAQVTPTVTCKFVGTGYEPEATWASVHAVATYNYGVPTPIESGFAYAQFKCQYKCNSYDGISFFVKYAGAGSKVGSYCTCYDELLGPKILVADNQTLFGAWNNLC